MKIGRVVLAEIVEGARGEGLAGREIAVGVPVEMDQLQRQVPGLGGGLEDLDGLGGHVLARAVAGQDCDASAAGVQKGGSSSCCGC